MSFFDSSTTSWVSYAGRARVSQDRDLISVTGYIGNLKDGVHTGDENDPRVSAIEVVPDEIRYWFTEKGAVPRTVQVAAGAVTGKATSPGELHTITNEEVSTHPCAAGHERLIRFFFPDSFVARSSHQISSNGNEGNPLFKVITL